jgi:Domain of unknown function (DUF4352)
MARKTRYSDEPLDERVPIIRWSRIAIGGGLIFVVIVLIVIENHFGLVAKPLPDSVPSGKATQLLGMATPIEAGGLFVEPKYIGSVNAAGSMAAAPGTTLLLVAIRVQNRGASTTVLDTTDFTVTRGDRAVASGRPYPGRPSALRVRSFTPGTSAEGILVFAVPRTANHIALSFRGTAASVTAAGSWRIPYP